MEGGTDDATRSTEAMGSVPVRDLSLSSNSESLMGVEEDLGLDLNCSSLFAKSLSLSVMQVIEKIQIISCIVFLHQNFPPKQHSNLP